MVLLYILVLVFFAFDRDNPQINFEELAFFLSYAAAALVISYFLLPRFFYKNKIPLFLICLAILLAMVMLTEELVLEQIFYSGSNRAKTFPGVLHTLLGVLPMIAILSGAKFAYDAFQKQKKLDAMQVAINESELQFLKSQINPHFLFNNLNNLYSHALENSPKTPEIILELSGVLRYMLYECKEESVQLSKEIDQLENFIRLNEMQIEERGNVTFSKKGIASMHKIAPLILVIFVENAFKHSTASQSGGIHIDININISPGGQLDFTCSNTYEKMSNTSNLAQGIGLANVKKRLVLIYPEKHQLEIKQTEDRYIVRLSLDLLKT